MPMTLEKEKAQRIVVIEWILFFLGVLILVVLCSVYMDTWFKTTGQYSYDNYSSKDKADIQLIVFSIIGVSLLIAVGINVILTVGVHKEHSTCCKVWYVINIISIVFQCLDVLVNLITLNLLGLPIAIACLWYRVYAGKTIKAFMDTLSYGGGGVSGGIVYSAPPHATTAAARVVDQAELVYHPPPPYNQLEQKC